jgi:hypothetical protein
VAWLVDEMWLSFDQAVGQRTNSLPTKGTKGCNTRVGLRKKKIDSFGMLEEPETTDGFLSELFLCTTVDYLNSEDLNWYCTQYFVHTY